MKTIEHTTLTECMNYCDSEDSFACISIDFTSSSTCYLSDESHETVPEMYGPYATATYAYVQDDSLCTGENDSEEDDEGNEGNEGSSNEGGEFSE